MAWIEVVGWVGMIFLLVAYALLSVKKIPSDSSAYQAMNVSGSLCLLINAWYHGSTPIAVFELIWAGIGFTMLYKIIGRKYGNQNN